jgi:hypothetical protein
VGLALLASAGVAHLSLGLAPGLASSFTFVAALLGLYAFWRFSQPSAKT